MLRLEEVIVESDDDMEIWSSIVVGFDILENFIIRINYTDYENRGYDYKSDAIIDKDEALGMANLLNTKSTNLPKIILKKFGCAYNTLVPSEVENLFKEILDFIIECGARYTLKRGGFDKNIL